MVELDFTLSSFFHYKLIGRLFIEYWLHCHVTKPWIHLFS